MQVPCQNGGCDSLYESLINRSDSLADYWSNTCGPISQPCRHNFSIHNWYLAGDDGSIALIAGVWLLARDP